MAVFKKSDLKDLFLFSGIDDPELEKITENTAFTVKSFAKDELIYQPDNYETSLGFVLKGACRVNKKRHDGALIPFNTLRKGDSFGAINLFTTVDDYPTYIYATMQTEVLFIPKQDAVRIIQENLKVAVNFIEFLTGRIVFLNSKISTFSSGSAEQKLANYLLTAQKQQQKLSFEFNKKLTSEAQIGRAHV